VVEKGENVEGLNIFNDQRKIKVFKPLSLQGRGLERGFLDPVRSQNYISY